MKLRYILKETINKISDFQVGDRVEVIRDPPPHSYKLRFAPIGECGTIVLPARDIENGPIINWDNDRYDRWAYTEQLRKIEPLFTLPEIAQDFLAIPEIDIKIEQIQIGTGTTRELKTRWASE
jgi:hypothetical protein